MSEPRVVVIKCCEDCGSGLGVESCGRYCRNYENNNPSVWLKKLKVQETRREKKPNAPLIEKEKK